MLLSFFITCISFSFILLFKSLSLKHLPPWANDMRLLLSFFPISNPLSLIQPEMSIRIRKKTTQPSKVENFVVCGNEMSVLDLPELVLECILERLPPDGLCSMAGVCTSLRDRCMNDHLWEKHMKQKWGRIIGSAAYREWQWHIASTKDSTSCILQRGKQKGLMMRYLSRLWPLSWFQSKLDIINSGTQSSRSTLPVDSIMSRYLALESGRFWFPAQVYNREHGHVGFMLSCYDAELSYDPHTDTFQARYPPHGRRAIAIENGVPWERLRAPPVDTSPHDLHISDCLNELCPGNHIEIQWRRNKEFPYGWWYGVVGHLESCDGNENYCNCHYSDTVVLEFNQYTPGSRWRHASINRKDHREEGNEADGFYGGIRKLYSNEEISMWKQLWPTDILE